MRAGSGRSLLPRVVGDGDPGLRPLARVAAVVEWLERTVAASEDGV